MVSTLDFESSDPSSSLGGTCTFFLLAVLFCLSFSNSVLPSLTLRATFLSDLPKNNDTNNKTDYGSGGIRTHAPKMRLVPETSALDRSATLPALRNPVDRNV